MEIFQKQKFGYFILIYKILRIVKQDWLILGWSDTEIQDKWDSFFLIFANFNQFRAIASCWHFQRPANVVLDFFYPQTLYFILVIKFVPVGIEGCIRDCKNMLKKSFQSTFFCWKLNKKVKYIKMPKEKH